MAAPNPCTARAAIRIIALGDNAHATDAAVKMAKPAMNTRLAPTRVVRRGISRSRQLRHREVVDGGLRLLQADDIGLVLGEQLQ